MTTELANMIEGQAGETDEAMPPKIESMPGFDLAWAVRGNWMEVTIFAPRNLQASGAEIVARTFDLELAREIDAVAQTEPFLRLRDFNTRRRAAIECIESSKAAIEAAKNGDAPDAASAAGLRKQIEEAGRAITEAELQKATIDRSIGDARAACKEIVGDQASAIRAEFARRLQQQRLLAAEKFYRVAESALIELASIQVADARLGTIQSRLDLLLVEG